MVMGRWLVVVLIGLVLAGVGCGIAGPSGGRTGSRGYSTVTAQELQAKIDAGEKLSIVDLREPELYRAGHIPGAVNIPFDQFNERMRALSPESKIVLACHTGPMGDSSGSLLAERGFTQVWNLSGGMAAWRGKLEK